MATEAAAQPVSTPAMETAPPPVPVTAPQSVAQPRETISAAPVPLPVSAPSETPAPAPVVSQPGVTARPEDILKNLSPAANLQQVETQGAAPAAADESAGISQHRPRRRRPASAPSTQMELMQVETSTPAGTEPALASAPAEASTQRTHGPGRRRRSGAPTPASEPLVQVETGQSNV
jgi:hypothetical protein